jgi:predicted acetyltransferase
VAACFAVRVPETPDLLTRLTLVRPSLALVASYLDFIEEMRALDETIWPTRVPVAGDSLDTFVAGLLVKETTPVPPAVAESVHWGVIDDRIVGFITLRHVLNERLARFGGHVSYEVRPSCRCQGVATGMLRLLLLTPRAKGLGRILVTCGPANLASRTTIERNGGILGGVVYVEEVQRETCHYWINLGADSR